jgi:hypothetical protein
VPATATANGLAEEGRDVEVVVEVEIVVAHVEHIAPALGGVTRRRAGELAVVRLAGLRA